MIEMTREHGEKLARYADWHRIEREVKRYINEGNDYFTVELGGFEVTFDATKGAKDENNGD